VSPALLALALAAGPSADPLAGLDAVIEKGLKSHKVPGLGVAVVKDGKVILARGYGVRTLGKPDPVTEKSLFAIGSVSKSFTAASIAMLVDEGKLGWNDKLADHLDGFRLKDMYRTREITLRDALAHRTGMARNELLWYGSPFDRREVLRRLRHVDIDTGFRTAFVYNNIMYMAAGEVIPAVTKEHTGWDDFVTARVFKPLGMATAITTITRLPKDGDVATPHERVNGKAAPVPWRNADNIGPAGSIIASAADMAEYVKFQLALGKAGGQRLLKRGVFEEMHRPQNLMPKPGFAFNPDALSHAYGLGWMLSDYKGKRVVEHGGNIDGMTAQVGMLPDEKIGVVVLANHGGSLLPLSLMWDIFDRMLGEPDQDRVGPAAVLAAVNGFAAQMVAAPDESARVKDTKPRLALDKYAGRYQDQLLDAVKVTFADGKLSATFNTWTFDVDHWHYDTFRAKDRTGVLPPLLFTFVLGADGKVAEVRWKLFTGEDMVMKRRP
jgi:CubicO group peptidase (beta-lactamase class C family)